MTDSIPARCRRCDSISPAGPAPMMPTWMRTLAPSGDHDCESRSTERRLEVGDEVLRILDADRKPHQAVADPERGAHVGRDRAMGHQRRMLDEAFDAAEAFGQGEQAAALEETLGLVEADIELGGDHAAEAAHLPFREPVLGMAREARIEDPAHLWMALEPF